MKKFGRNATPTRAGKEPGQSASPRFCYVNQIPAVNPPPRPRFPRVSVARDRVECTTTSCYGVCVGPDVLAIAAGQKPTVSDDRLSTTGNRLLRLWSRKAQGLRL